MRHNGEMDVSDFAKTIKLNILRVLAEQSVSKNELSRRTGIEVRQHEISRNCAR